MFGSKFCGEIFHEFFGCGNVTSYEVKIVQKAHILDVVKSLAEVFAKLDVQQDNVESNPVGVEQLQGPFF